LTQQVGTLYPTLIASLSDDASIVEALEFYHLGLNPVTGGYATNSIEGHFKAVNDRVTSVSSSLDTTNTTVSNLASTVDGLTATYVEQVSSSASPNIITPQAASVVPLVIKGVNSQTANLQQWQNSSGTVVARVDSTGKLFAFDGTSTLEVANLSGTQTFTNKTLTTPIQTIGTVSKTANYTLALTDQSRIIEVNSSSATTIAIPLDKDVAFPVGTYVVVMQTGTGQVTIASVVSVDGSVTINSTPGLKTRTQWSMVTLIKRGTNLWFVAGDLVA
jgi:hypothetical protein